MDAALSSVLAQVVVAHTIEADNAFEAQMMEPGVGQGWAYSLSLWVDMIRHIPTEGISVGALLDAAGSRQAIAELGGLERWGFATLTSDAHPRGRRHIDAGYGGWKGIGSDWIVRPTPGGARAQAVWQPLLGVIEERWRDRLGGAMTALDAALGPFGTADQSMFERLLRLWRAYEREHDEGSDVPLAVAANALRVLGDEPVAVNDLPMLTGIAKRRTDPEITFLTRLGCVTVSPAASGRGKVVALTSHGRAAQERHAAQRAAVDATWAERFGVDAVDALRVALDTVVAHPALGAGLAPDPRCWRARRPWSRGTEALVAEPRAHLPHALHVSQGGWPDGA